MASSSHPIIVIVPGAALTPSHYAYLLHLLHSQGYGTFSAPLPSTVGGSKPVTVEDDTEFVRSQMLLPVMDTEQHDVVIVTHSYSGIPGSAACHGLGKTERASKGYKTSVIGQISIASVLVKGGDGKDPVAKFGGELPPHIQADKTNNLIRCEKPIPPLFHDLSPEVAATAVSSTISPSLTSFKSPCPRTTWDTKDFQHRLAYIRSTNDQAISFGTQNNLIYVSGQEWIIKDIKTGHNTQLAAPEKLCEIIVELAKHFEAM